MIHKPPTPLIHATPFSHNNVFFSQVVQVENLSWRSCPGKKCSYWKHLSPPCLLPCTCCLDFISRGRKQKGVIHIKSVVIIRNKEIIERTNTERSFLGRSPNNFVFTSSFHTSGIHHVPVESMT